MKALLSAHHPLVHMKFLPFTLIASAWVCMAHAAVIETPVDQPIPDGSLSGLASTINLSGLSAPVGNVEVELNISGTYNGDLYAYLTHGSGFTVLLNRVGRTATDGLGYADGGLNVTFADGATDIHAYRVSLFGNSSTALGGPLTGTWGPDGRAVSPTTVTDVDTRSALLSSFDGLDANGSWTLFVADVSGGDLNQLNSWTLDLNCNSSSVPDGGSIAGLLLTGMAAVALVRWTRCWCKQKPMGARPSPSLVRGAPSVWVIGLAAFLGCNSPSRAYTGGSVTSWGEDVAFPLAGYGARFIQISASGDHNLALKEDGTVVAWGQDAAGECQVPAGLNGVKATAAGEDHSLALKADGTVVAWGFNDGGQCDVPNGLNDIKAIAGGPDFSLALRQDGTLVSWGNVTLPSGLSDIVAISSQTALKADGTVVNLQFPYDVPAGLTGVIAVADYLELQGEVVQHLALKSDGTVVAWGDNSSGQLDVPSGLSDVVGIAAGLGHRLALKRDGTVVAWGDNNAGQCDVPSGLSGVISIAAGLIHSLALKGDGTVVGWGDDGHGQTTSPNGLNDVVAIASGLVHGVAVKADGTVRSWGSNEFGALDVPDGLDGVVAISAFSQNLALKSDGTVVAWGDNRGGGVDVPPSLSSVVAVAAGYTQSLALKSDGTVVGWGDLIQFEPYLPPDLNEVVAIATAGGIEGFGDHTKVDFHTLALKVDGTVAAWANIPGTVPPSGLNHVVAIAVGSSHSLALKSDGTVVAWGNDDHGQCDVPPSLTGVLAISASNDNSLALKSDGTVVAWGANNQVPSGLGQVVAISAGFYDNVALFGGVNHPPRAASYQMATSQNAAASLPLFKLHMACSDPDWDTFIITRAGPSSASGGTAEINGSTIVYTPPVDFTGSDSFTYTVRDSRGASSQGTVSVTVTAASGNGLNIINVSVAPGGAATIQCAGIPGVSYVLEASTDLVQWTQLTSATAGANGLFVLIDAQAGNFTNRYYRTASNPEAP
jgi:alpha-tubulin suppressor-like RCC1 family protein/subtilisin-like proprotein convertase family protein